VTHAGKVLWFNAGRFGMLAFALIWLIWIWVVPGPYRDHLPLWLLVLASVAVSANAALAFRPQVRVDDRGVTIRRTFHRAVTVPWDDIVSAQEHRSRTSLLLRDGSSVPMTGSGRPDTARLLAENLNRRMAAVRG
jgi:hypothetical protein